MSIAELFKSVTKDVVTKDEYRIYLTLLEEVKRAYDLDDVLDSVKAESLCYQLAKLWFARKINNAKEERYLVSSIDEIMGYLAVHRKQRKELEAKEKSDTPQALLFAVVERIKELEQHESPKRIEGQVIDTENNSILRTNNPPESPEKKSMETTDGIDESTTNGN